MLQIEKPTNLVGFFIPNTFFGVYLQQIAVSSVLLSAKATR